MSNTVLNTQTLLRLLVRTRLSPSCDDGAPCRWNMPKYIWRRALIGVLINNDGSHLQDYYISYIECSSNAKVKALDGGEWSASCPCRFTSGERAPGTCWIRGWVGPRFGLDAVEKRKILHSQESNPDRLACSPSLYRLSYPDSPSNAIGHSPRIKFTTNKYLEY
jgi:hypothetical protein